MTVTEYIIGNVVRCSTTFANLAGTPTDPTTVAFKFMNPAGTTTTYTYPANVQLVKDSTGVYHVDIDANAEGVWSYRFYSTGTGQAADEGKFAVIDSPFA